VLLNNSFIKPQKKTLKPLDFCNKDKYNSSAGYKKQRKTIMNKQDLTYTYPKNKLFDAMRICYIYNVVRPESVPKRILDISDLSPKEKNKRFSKLKYEQQFKFFELEELMNDSGFNNINDISKKLNKGMKNDK
jgi:hypothetical protein